MTMRVAILHSCQNDPDHARGGKGASSSLSTREAPQAQPQQEPVAGTHWAPEYALFEHDRHKILATVLAQLKPREADLLQRRFGLRSGEVETLQEISCVLGISRERVRQIEKRALRTLQDKFADGLPGAADFL